MKKSTSKIVMTGLNVAGGVAAGRIVSKLPFVNANPTIRIIAPLVGAFAVNKFMGKKGDALAAGMVAASALDAVATFAPGIAANAGVAGLGGGTPYKSLHFPGVAGTRSAVNNEAVQIRMQ